MRLPSYYGLSLNYFHSFVDHLTRYVSGRIHTNGGRTSGRSSNARSKAPTFRWLRSTWNATLMSRRSATTSGESDQNRFYNVLCAVGGKRHLPRAHRKGRRGLYGIEVMPRKQKESGV